MYIKFDLTLIPSNAIIKEANLSLTEIPFSESAFWYREEPVTDYQLDSKLKLYKVTNNWNETSITDFVEAYSTVSFDSTSLIDSYKYSSGSGKVSFNVTKSINDMLDGGIENFGFVMMTDYRFTFAKSPGGSVTYWHSGQSDEIDKRPMLNLTYSLDGNTHTLAIGRNNEGSIKCRYERQGALKLKLKDDGIYNIRVMNLKGQELINIKGDFNVGLSWIPIRKLNSGLVVVQINNVNINKTIQLLIP